MNTDYTLLAEKEGMWAEMLMQVLRDNGIPCTAIPVYGGAGDENRQAGAAEGLRPESGPGKSGRIAGRAFPTRGGIDAAAFWLAFFWEIDYNIPGPSGLNIALYPLRTAAGGNQI